MKQLLEDFHAELLDALLIAEKSSFTQSESPIDNITITGLGGSGIGGSIAYALLNTQIAIPFTVNKGYFLPNFIGTNSLVIVCSYSGNTEESIHAFAEAVKKKANIVCITSGGKLETLAKNHGCNYFIIPSNRPPRASLGYSLVQIIATLVKLGLVQADIYNEIRGASAFLQADKANIKLESEKLSAKIFDKTPVIYCEDSLEPIAIRWKQQLNENSKMLCWHNVYPELNHNELVGWRQANKDIALLFLLTGDEYYRNKHRMQLNRSIFSAVTDSIYDIEAKGDTHIQKLFYLIHFGDWLSYFLAIKRAYDPMEIDVLIKLKDDLSNIQ